MSNRFSRCSLGKSRWFWCVWNHDAFYRGLPPFDSGYSSSAEEAEEEIKGKYPGAASCQAYFAMHQHQAQVQASRKPNTDAKGSKPVEYLYTDWESEYDSSFGSTPRPIIKKTKKCVFVLDSNGRTRRFDRAKLEAEGNIMGRGWWEVFHTTPIEERRPVCQPEWARVLGVDRHAGKADIEKAYHRRALETHPDRGGDPNDFKKVQAAWESAMNILA